MLLFSYYCFFNRIADDCRCLFIFGKPNFLQKKLEVLKDSLYLQCCLMTKCFLLVKTTNLNNLNLSSYEY